MTASTDSLPAARAHAPADRAAAIGLRVLQAGPVLILGLLCVVMALSSPYFATERNLANLGFQASFVGVLAIGAGGGFATVVAFAATGLAVGLANGAVLVWGRVMNPFIVTLGMLGIVRGLALVISDGQTRTGLPPVVDTLGTGTVAGVPVPVILVAGFALVIGALLGRTQWGRWIYAVGGNPEAA